MPESILKHLNDVVRANNIKSFVVILFFSPQYYSQTKWGWISSEERKMYFRYLMISKIKNHKEYVREKMCHENNEFNYILNAWNCFIHRILCFIFTQSLFLHVSWYLFLFFSHEKCLKYYQPRKCSGRHYVCVQRCCSQCCLFRDNHWIWYGRHVWDSK